MEIKGINILEEKLKKHNGEDAVIRISHKLYGIQKMQAELNYICDEKRIGFFVKDGQEIYIYKDEVREFGIEGSIYFADDLMRIDIKLHEQ